jgi:hypothetical protein
MGKLTSAQAHDAEKRARDNHERVERHWIREHLVEPQLLCTVLGKQTGMTMIGLDESSPVAGLQEMLPRSVAEEHMLVPFRHEPGVLFVACAYPLPELVVGELRRTCGLRIELFLSPYDQIRRAWDRMWTGGGGRQARSHQTNVPVTYYFCDEGATEGTPPPDAAYSGLIVGINAHGCVVEGPPEPGAAAALPETMRCLCLTLAEYGAPAQCLCRIVEVRPTGDPQRSHFILTVCREDSEGARQLKQIHMRVAFTRIARK